MAQKGSNTAYIMKKNGTLSVAHEDQIHAREMEQITPIQTEGEGDGLNSMDLSNNESSMDAEHRTQPANLESPELVNKSPMDIPVRRSQRANFDAPPIRWGHVES